MRVSRSRSLATIVGVVLTIVGCDTTEPSPLGAIRVVVNPAGEDINLAGLRISVVNGPTRQLNTGLELTILDLAEGVHTVRLDGLVANCQVASANPRSVTVIRNQATTAEFNVVCVARMG